MPFGWTGKILRVDLTDQNSVIEDVMPYAQSYKCKGG
jgi:hypothetical protein